jgi:GNAT superfamily N-acetyltransferase
VAAPAIRLAGPGDAGAIADIHVDSWLVAYRGLLDQDYLDRLTVDGRTRQWERVLGERTTDRVWVAERDGRPVGFAHAGPSRDADLSPDTGELYTLYARPDVWGSGAGAALLAEVVASLAGDGYATAALWVLDTNARARRFYHRQGWAQVDGVRTQQFGASTVTDVRYGRPLL